MGLRSLVGLGSVLALASSAVAFASPRKAGSAHVLVTDTSEYVATGLPAKVTFQIKLKYTNRSGQPRYLPGCQGPPPGMLEKLDGKTWVTAFAPIVNACLSYPVPVVAPGETFEFTFSIYGSLDGAYEPTFHVREVPGTYRVRWRVYRTMERRTPDGVLLPVEAYTDEVFSNTFAVVTEPHRTYVTPAPTPG